MNEDDNVFGESIDFGTAQSMARLNYRQLKNDNPGYTYSNINEKTFLENGSYKFVIYWSRKRSEEITTTTSITEESIRKNAEEYTKANVIHKYTEEEIAELNDNTGQNEGQQGSILPDPAPDPETETETETTTFNYKETFYVTEIESSVNTEQIEINFEA